MSIPPRYRTMLNGPHECCFPAMMVDKALSPDARGKICECLSFAYAEQIALALNHSEMA